MKRPAKYFLVILFFLVTKAGVTQNQLLDSALSILTKSPGDTEKVNTLNFIAWQFKNSKPDSGIFYSNKALGLSQQLNWKKGIALSYHKLGVFQDAKGEFTKSLDNYEKALVMWEELIRTSGKKDGQIFKKEKTKTLGNIGVIYLETGNYTAALKYSLASLKTDRELGDMKEVAADLINIGIIYGKTGDYNAALGNNLEALKIGEQMNDQNLITMAYVNTGLIYKSQKNYTKSIEYFNFALVKAKESNERNKIAVIEGNIGNALRELGGQNSLSSENLNRYYDEALQHYLNAFKITEEAGNKGGMARHLTNIGIVYYAKKEYEKALQYYEKALAVKEEIGDKLGAAINLGNIGSLLTEQKKYKEAEIYLLKAYKIENEIGARNEKMQTEQFLSRLYEKNNKYESALKFFQKYIITKDSLFNEEKSKEMTRKEMSYEFEKKEAAVKAEQEKKNLKSEEEKRKQQIILWFTVSGLVIVLALAGIILRSLILNKRKNKIISAQKELVEAQKNIVEEKQKEILDSIHYAKRIQTALITSEKYFTRKLNELNK